MNRFVVISGCSGGGKSTLVAALARRGYGVVQEPGRRIVRQERQGSGRALPWIDPAAFARRAMAMATADLTAAAAAGDWVFFDRSLVDAAAALQHATGEPALTALIGGQRYHRTVFLAPPWPEIYATEDDRQHGFDTAAAEYGRLVAAYLALGYRVTVLPKVGVAERVEFVLDALSEGRHGCAAPG